MVLEILTQNKMQTEQELLFREHSEYLPHLNLDHYKKKVCNKFVKKANKTNTCHACQKSLEEHETHDEVMSLWDSGKCTITEPTDAYGQLKFSGLHSKRASYIRISNDTDPKDFLQYMYSDKGWGMDVPNVLLSVIDGSTNFKLPSRIKKAFKRGLMKATINVGAWIVTDGVNCGITKLVGEAVSDESHKTSPTVIGIANWGRLALKDKMIEHSGEVLNYFEAMGEKQCQNQTLESNHTHFILVDDGSVDHSSDSALDFRVAFENKIREGNVVKYQDCTVNKSDYRYPSDTESISSFVTDITIPTIVIVVNGGLYTLKAILMYLEKNIPVLILAGSKGIADVIAKVVGSKDNINETIREALKEIDVPRNRLEKTALDLKMINDKYIHLINVFRLNNDETTQDIELAILRTFLNSRKENYYENLIFAMKWNRYDIAKTDIFTGDEKFKAIHLENAMQMALEEDLPEFVELILENGLLMKKFLTNMRLYYLYNSDKIRKTKLPLTELLNVLSEMDGEKDVIMFRDIGRIFKRFIFDRFDFKMVITEDVSEDVVRSFMNDHKKLPEMTTHQVICQHVKSITLSNYKQNIFIWSLLLNRTKIARLFWPTFKNQIFNALFASNILKSFAKHLPDNENDFKDSASQFEQLAFGVFELYDKYTEPGMNRILLLHRNNPFKVNILEMAVAADCKQFLSYSAVQDVLNSIWCGKLNQSPRFRDQLKFFLSYLSFGLLAPFLAFPAEEHCEEHQDKRMMADKIEKLNKNPVQRGDLLNRSNIPNGFIEEHDEFEKCKKENAFKKYIRKYWTFIKTPKVRFLYDVTSFTLFLLLFNYMLLCDFSCDDFDTKNSFDNLNSTHSLYSNKSTNNSGFLSRMLNINELVIFKISEIVLTFWILSFLFEEIRQFVDKSCDRSLTQGNRLKTSLKLYFNDEWNYLDLSGCLLFLIGMTLHSISTFTNFKLNDTARLILCLDLFVWYMKLLHVTLAIKFIGPKLVMIRKMLQDLMLFMFIIFIFMCSFAVVTQSAMYPGNVLSFKLLKKLVDNAYWPILGDMKIFYDIDKQTCFPDEEKCPRPEGQLFSYVALMVYMLIINVLLLNLLIAVFSNIFDSVQTNTDKIWKFQRFDLVMEYCDSPLFVAPFNIFESIYRIFYGLCKGEKKKKYLQPENLLQEDDLKCLNEFEEKICIEYLSNLNQNKNEESAAILKTNTSRLNIIEQKLNSFLDKKIKRTDEDTEIINRLIKGQEDMMTFLEKKFGSID